MLNDFQMFEKYMASPTFKNLPEIEKEEFISSYRNLLEEEMEITLQEAKQYLDQKTLADLFYRIYGHLDKQALSEKDDQWNITFGFRPSSMKNNTSW
ncbi:MAG: hypothetical protein ACXWCG_00100 [Flavitalea sp.]